MKKETSKFFEDNYDDILEMAFKISLDEQESQELAHFCILEFTKSKKIDEVISRGEGMLYMSGIMHRSYHSSSSVYYKLYKQAGREVRFPDNYVEKEVPEEEYIDDMEIIEFIEKLIDVPTNNIREHYKMTLLKEYIETPNYSALSRKFDIPRTSIAIAVKEARKEILDAIRNRDTDD